MVAPALQMRKTTNEDLNAVLRLLKSSDLPLEGVVEHFGYFLVAEYRHQVVGAVGLEHYGDAGLLRSLVVAPEYRGQGLGTRLVEDSLAQAKAAGVTQVYLLTNTAADFFPRFGFQRISREDATAAVRDSAEFTSACCQTAVCLKLEVA